jgi:crotonobetainyl-CoA:carnitine CoA-transferase CaiB-like acyl-CoA transferase
MGEALLEGVRVLEVALLGAGATGMHLADLGADVIKVEQPGLGDSARVLGRLPTLPVSPMHCHWNRGKRSVAVDLHLPEGKEVFQRLAAQADAVIEGLRAGTLESWGLGYPALRASNPKLVFLTVSGFGRTGPYHTLPSHGMGFDAWAGHFAPAAGPEGWPTLPNLTPIGGIAGPLYGAYALVAAILRARVTGTGCDLDISEADVAAGWDSLSMGVAEARRRAAEAAGEEPGADEWFFEDAALYQYYETSDGHHILFMAVEPKFWERFCQAVERADLLGRHPGEGLGDRALRRDLAALFRTRTRAQWVECFVDANIPGVPVNRRVELGADAQFRARNRWLPVEEHGMPMLAPPVHVNAAQPEPAPAPSLGAHTEEVLTELLGLDRPAIDDLREREVVR